MILIFKALNFFDLINIGYKLENNFSYFLSSIIVIFLPQFFCFEGYRT